MDKFGMNILDAMMANLNCFDNYQIINLHKQTTEEVHKRLNNINDVDECHDCNCEYDCRGECHKNKPRRSVCIFA